MLTDVLDLLHTYTDRTRSFRVFVKFCGLKSRINYILKSLERMMVRWMCGESLKDRKHSEDLCTLPGIWCVADVVRQGRLRWFGHHECKFEWG